MKYRITVAVDGDCFADNDFQVGYQGFTIGIVVNKDSSVKELYIEKRVSKGDELPSIEPGKGEVKFNVTYRKPKCRDELIEKLIYFESIGAFWWRIKSFNIDEANEQWIPENDEDQSRITLLGITTKRSYGKNPQPIRDHQIKDLLDMEAYEEPMTVPLAFYRESVISFESHRYINAFQNAFLMIEGLYGQGKSGYRQIVNALCESPELKTATAHMLEQLRAQHPPHHLQVMTAEINKLGKNVDVIGMIEWLVHTRGQLNHFSLKSNKRQGNPLRHREYRTHAYVCQSICLLIYIDFHKKVLDDGGFSTG